MTVWLAVLKNNLIIKMDKVKNFESFLNKADINEREIPDKQGEILVILGPPGSGKGTISKRLVDKNEFTHISTGDLIRNSEDEELKKIIKKGDFIPDRVMVRMLRKALGKADLEKGIIIDGFPRNVKQSKMLDSLLGKMGVGLNHVIYLDLDEDKAKERISKRSEKENRDDDKDAEVISKRFNEYKEKTLPLIKKYKKSRKLVKIDASKKIENVYKQLLKKIGLQYKSKDEGKEEKTS
jgi:adenylate kinase